MSTTVTVRTQAEFDEAFANLKDDAESTIIIDSPRGVWVTVEAYGSSTVKASGSSMVEASGSSTVRAYDSSTVEAYGSSTVWATPCVAVHLFSASATISGGVIIDVAGIDRTDGATWASYHGVAVSMHTADDGSDELIVYKAVDDDLKSGRGFTYPIGETVEDVHWKAGDFCRGGLHFSPHPHQAKNYFSGATRFLECAVSVAEISIIGGNRQGTPKLKAKRARVLREVTIGGDPIEQVQS